jgi:Leu/Phe-tRNA-protein transferase
MRRVGKLLVVRNRREFGGLLGICLGVVRAVCNESMYDYR